MAKLTVTYYSKALVRNTTFKMFIPNDPHEDAEADRKEKKPMKTIFLLHGYTGDADNWIPEYIAEKYNFAIVIPSGENGFWLDGLATGHKFATFVGEELVSYVRATFGLAMTAEDTYIMGLSMGGFGSLHTALAYPDTFSKTIALSSALIMHEVSQMKDGIGNSIANYYYYRECFGEPEKLLESDNNPETLVKKLIVSGKKIPDIYMACGTEDFLLEENRSFHKFLEEQNVEHTYIESPGVHNMEFWSQYVVKFTDMIFG